SLALALFVFRILADYPHYSTAVDNLALVTDLFDRRSYFHSSPLISLPVLFIPVDNPSAGQIIRRELHYHLVARQYLYEIFTHLPGDMRQYLMFVLQFDPKHSVRQRLYYRSDYFDCFFFWHKPIFTKIAGAKTICPEFSTWGPEPQAPPL